MVATTLGIVAIALGLLDAAFGFVGIYFRPEKKAGLVAYPLVVSGLFLVGLGIILISGRFA